MTILLTLSIIFAICVVVLFAKKKIPEEHFKIAPIPFHTLNIIGIIRPYESVPEKPGIILEHIVRGLEPKRMEVLDRKHGRRPSIALTKRMDLPYLGDETGKMRNCLTRCHRTIIEFPFVYKITDKRLSDCIGRTVSDRFTLQYPFTFAYVDAADLSRRRQNTFEEFSVNSDKILWREFKSSIINDCDNTLRYLIGFFFFGTENTGFVLRSVIIPNTPSGLILRDSTLDMLLGGIEKKS